MVTFRRLDGAIEIETSRYHCRVVTDGYVSGVQGGSFRDRETGATDLGHGLVIADFLLEPDTPPRDDDPMLYHVGDLYHGNLPKRYVEGPQICTKARHLDWRTFEGEDFVALQTEHRWTEANPPYQPGSTWQQTLVFQDGLRYFFAADRITSANDVGALAFRHDMPGHLKHQSGDRFEVIHLSYAGRLPADQFCADFPPDQRNLYRRQPGQSPPELFFRAYKVRGGPWLAGITLAPDIVSEAWCHQRGYVCFIQEIGGRPVRRGESFGAAYIVGWFDAIEEVERVAADFAGVCGIRLDAEAERPSYTLLR